MKYFYLDHIVRLVIGILVSLFLYSSKQKAAIIIIIIVLGYTMFYVGNLFLLLIDFVCGIKEEILCCEMKSEEVFLVIYRPKRFYYCYRFSKLQSNDDKVWLINPSSLRFYENSDLLQCEKGQLYRVIYGCISRIILSVEKV